MRNIKGLCLKWQKTDNYIVLKDLPSIILLQLVWEEPTLKSKLSVECKNPHKYAYHY